MKRLYLDCGMGAAGDMLAAALYELLDDNDRKVFLDTMNSAVPDGVSIEIRPETKCGVSGTHFDVLIQGEKEQSIDAHDISQEHTHEHTHTHTHDPEHTHTHAHDHEHTHINAHVHTHTHTHDSEHEHAHSHSHGDYSHENEHHAHHSMSDVENIIKGFACIDSDVRSDILEVYKVIAAAESKAHGMDVSEIHFHEVGMMDAIIDVTSVCLLMHMLKADEVYASPVRVGKGFVKCAHGILPVPAPATAYILMGIPTYAGDIEAELCTPTGAALLRHFVNSFGDQPLMSVEKIGYGMGTKDFKVCNCVRSLLG